jgi:hypothetical protein
MNKYGQVDLYLLGTRWRSVVSFATVALPRHKVSPRYSCPCGEMSPDLVRPDRSLASVETDLPGPTFVCEGKGKVVPS